MKLFFLVILALFLLSDFYVSFSFLHNVSVGFRLLFWFPTFSILIMLLIGRFQTLNEYGLKILMLLVLCVAIPKLLFTVCSLIGRLVALLTPLGYLISNIVGIVIAVLACISMLYGMLFGWKRLSVEAVDISFTDLPSAFDGYQIVQISDIHIGSYGKRDKFIRKVVEKVNAIKPDLIVFTGDLINICVQEINPFITTLSRLSAQDGVFSVLGNHDYCLYRFSPHRIDPHVGKQEVVKMEEAMGWKVLLNSHHIIKRDEDSIIIVGVENIGKPPFPEFGNLPKALKGLKAKDFKILLSHDPSHWRMEVVPSTNIALTLSGHTHAGQFQIGHWSPSQWLYDEWCGLYQEGKQYLYVNTGIGGTIPLRLGVQPKITIITLRKVK